ncbi:MAG: hypothetical protein V3V16_16070 [Melioribacteraceae bacterium]
MGNFIRVIKQTKDGKVFVGTNSGLSILDNNEIRNYPLKNKFGVTQIYSIMESDSGEVYLGTQTGLVILKNEIVIKEEESEKIGTEMMKNLVVKVFIHYQKQKTVQ